MTPPSTDNQAKDTADLGPRIDTLLKEIEETRERVEASLPVESPVLDEPPPENDLAAAVETILAKTEAPGVVDAGANAFGAIESLDAQLAELTAELLGHSPVPPAPIAEPLEVGELSAPVAPSAPPPDLPITPTAAPIAPMPVPMAAPAAPTRPPQDGFALVAAVELATPPTTAPAAAPTKRGPSLFVRLLTQISAQLLRQSPAAQRGAGVLALFTLLLAAGVWALLIFRPPPAQPAPFDLSASTLPQPNVQASVTPKARTTTAASHTQPEKGSNIPAR
jgi:hypothetical protein